MDKKQISFLGVKKFGLDTELPKGHPDDYGFRHQVQAEIHDRKEAHVASNLGFRVILIISFRACI